jgi:hypothetical protein
VLWTDLLCAAELIVELGDSAGVTLVGAMNRWDADGNPRKPVDPKARIDAPELTATAQRREGNRWLFPDLPPGRYDLVIVTAGRVRVEGFHYPPVVDFDPILPPTSEAPSAPRELVLKDIAQGRYYENKVTPLFTAGDSKQVRVLMQLLRDEPTSFDSQFGVPVATLRYEVWQYTHRYGGWEREKRTRVLHRILMAKNDLRRWSWIWEPRLGNIELADLPRTISYRLPATVDPTTARGLLPE